MLHLRKWLGFKDERRPRGYRPEVSRLEGREVPTTAVGAVTVTPSILNPPDNSFRQVTVSGTIVESNLKVTPNVSYQVVDEYRQIQPLGKVTIKPLAPYFYTYSFTLALQAKRVNEYAAGRHYYILVKSADNQNAVGVYKPVIVPHDKLQPGQTIPSTVQPTPQPKVPKIHPSSIKKHAPLKASSSKSNSLFGGLF